MNTIFSQQATNPSEDSEPSDTTTDKEATEAVHQNGHDNEEKITENGSEQTLNTEEEQEDLEDESRGQKNATKKLIFRHGMQQANKRFKSLTKKFFERKKYLQKYISNFFSF